MKMIVIESFIIEKNTAWKCPYLEFFWYVFWHIQGEYGSPNAGKFGPEKLSSGNWNHLTQSSKSLFTITKFFYIFNVLLYGLAFEVKHSKFFYILPTSLVHPDTEKPLCKHPKIRTFKVFSQVFKQTNFLYISEKYFFSVHLKFYVSIWKNCQLSFILLKTNYRVRLNRQTTYQTKTDFFCYSKQNQKALILFWIAEKISFCL